MPLRQLPILVWVLLQVITIAAVKAEPRHPNEIVSESEQHQSSATDRAPPPQILDDVREPSESERDSESITKTDFAAGDEGGDNLAAYVKNLERRLKILESAAAKKSAGSDSPSGAKRTYPTYKFSGFIQLDSAWYSQDPLNIATVGDAQDGTAIRRARLAMLGKVDDKTNYQIEVDFATAGRPSFFDTYVEQEDLPFFDTLRIGHFLQPFSVDALSGFRNLPFLERSLPFLAFVPFRRLGAMSSIESDDEMTHLAYSVFRTGGFNNAPLGDDRYATDIGDVGGYSFSTRLTQLLQYDTDASLWQVGMSYDYSQLGADDAAGSGTAGNAGSPKPFYLTRVQPEFGVLGYSDISPNFGNAANGTPAFVSSGRYEAENFQMLGFEMLAQDGPWTIQSEWMGTAVQSVVGPVYYQGAYGEVLYRLTGEHRVYDKKLASLKNPIPNCDFISTKCDGIKGWGAWEVGFRWSFVNIRNPASLDGHYYNSATNTFNTTSKEGNGILNNATVGLSWFINEHTKFQFNWIHSILDNSANSPLKNVACPLSRPPPGAASLL